MQLTIKKSVSIALTLTFVGILGISFAHEYVLIASKFNVTKGDTLELRLFVADGFNIELERPFQKEAISRYNLISQNGITNLLNHSKDGQYPILSKTVDFDGQGLVHMERNYSRISLPNKKFQEYLKEDRLDNIRFNPTTNKSSQRERYTRYIKCLVQGDSTENDTLYRATVHQNLEIILLSNPYKLNYGKSLKGKVLFMGKPLVNKIVFVRNRTGNQSPSVILAKTDSKGLFSFILNRKGDWFIHTTHMIPSPDLKDADWESFWSSYSFGTKY